MSTEVESAQVNYDAAVAEAAKADAAARDRHKDIRAAKERLDAARLIAAAAIPVDRSARQLSGGGPVTDDHREINP